MTVACKRFSEGQPGGEQGGDDVRMVSANHPHHHHNPLPSSWWSSRRTHIRRGRRRGMRSRPRLAMLLTNFNPWLYSTLRLYSTPLYSRRSSVVEHPTEFLLLKTACDKSGETWSFAAAFASIASKLFENYGTFETISEEALFWSDPCSQYLKRFIFTFDMLHFKNLLPLKYSRLSRGVL